jgi:hypothetical protein
MKSIALPASQCGQLQRSGQTLASLGSLQLRRRRVPPLRSRRCLPCTARLTSSRDSIDEEQLLAHPELPLLSQSTPASPPYQQQQQQQQQRTTTPPSSNERGSGTDKTGLPAQLSIRDLQQLTELHVADVYRCGVVGSPQELAAALGASPWDGLCEGQVRAGGWAAGCLRKVADTVHMAPRQPCFLFVVLLRKLSACLDMTVHGHDHPPNRCCFVGW